MIETLAVLGAVAALVFAVLWYRQRQTHATLREQCGDSLQKQKARLRAEQNRLLNALSDTFILINPEGTIVFANETASELVAGRILLNRNIKEVFLDDRLTCAMEESLESGKAVTHQVNLPQQASPRGPAERRGETAWIIDAAPLDRNAKKTVTRVIIRDVTAEHQTEQVRKDFVANASHELRTPLTIINGYLENFLEDSEQLGLPPHYQRGLELMQRHGGRIARIIEDMLVISKLESGEASAINREPFLFIDCVNDVLERLEPVIQSQAAKIKLKIEDEDTLTIEGDRFYWTQILFNLIENALKQNPRIPLKIEVGAKKTDEGLHLWISDNGVGIPSTDLPYIFRRFYRVEKHHNQQEIKGTGLGLSIVKRAIEAHEGDIEVTSTPGQRTTFNINLPKTAIGSFQPSLEVPQELPAGA